MIKICDGVRENTPYLHLIEIELMARDTTEQNALCPSPKFRKLAHLGILEYLEVKCVVMNYSRLNFDNF